MALNYEDTELAFTPAYQLRELIKFAEEEFCDDWGMCFKYVWDNFKLWKVFFENMDMKLDVILNLIQNPTQTKPEGIKTISGKHYVLFISRYPKHIKKYRKAQRARSKSYCCRTYR